MKKKRYVLFSFIYLFLLTFSPWSFAEEKKKYPPYPDVWVREFVDYLDDSFLFIYPLGENEVLVYQPSSRDRNGEPVRDARGDTIPLMETLLFFQGTTVGLKEARELRRNWGVDDLTKERINSCYVGVTSEYKDFKDGGAIRWVNEVVKKKGGWLEGWRTAPGGRHKSFHTTYYNDVSVLERTDASGRILWQKVYLYFHPWWGSQPDKSVDADAYSFYYFKRGCLSLIDDRRVFLHFSGSRNIYRLDSQGFPKTNDKRLIVLDYSEYERLVRGVLDKIDNAKVARDAFPNPQYGTCTIKSWLPKGGIVYLGDYDYTGEVLAKRFGFNLESKEVKRVRNAMLEGELQRCAEAYYKMLKE